MSNAILTALAAAPNLSLRELAAAIGAPVFPTSEALALLVAEGHVVRHSASATEAKRYSLTQRGLGYASPPPFVAVCPRTGGHLRPATEAEIVAYWVCNRPAPFDRAVLIGEVLIDTDTGPGTWFGGAGF